MNDSKIAVRYAKALFELATEKKVAEKVYADSLLIQQLVKLPEIMVLLESPIIATGKKSNAFIQVLKGKIQDITESFVGLVFKNKREIHLAGIARNFITFYKKSKNIKTVEITTAVKMDDQLKDNFRKQILKTLKADIDLVTLTDENIVGGFIVQVDDILYDASVKRQLKNIKQSLLTEKL